MCSVLPPPFAPCLHSGKLSDDLISLVNKARKDAGLSTVQFSQELEDAAQKEADGLAGQGLLTIAGGWHGTAPWLGQVIFAPTMLPSMHCYRIQTHAGGGVSLTDVVNAASMPNTVRQTSEGQAV
jgi:hypothetical protein